MLGWALILFSVAAAVAAVLLVFIVYGRLSPELGLISDKSEAGQVAIRMVASLMEPDRMDYFPAWSTGEIFCRFDENRCNLQRSSRQTFGRVLGPPGVLSDSVLFLQLEELFGPAAT